MSSVQLLDKTRKIGKLLHNNNSSKVVFNDICDVMQDILESNVLVISKKGKVLGIDHDSKVEPIHELIKDKVGGFIDNLLNERILRHWVSREMISGSILRLLLRLTLRERDWEPCSYIRTERPMI